MAKRGGLGMGLDSLISRKMDNDLAKKVEPGKEDVSRETMIPISKIEPNRDQPRRQFDEAALAELAELYESGPHWIDQIKQRQEYIKADLG